MRRPHSLHKSGPHYVRSAEAGYEMFSRKGLQQARDLALRAARRSARGDSDNRKDSTDG